MDGSATCSADPAVTRPTSAWAWTGTGYFVKYEVMGAIQLITYPDKTHLYGSAFKNDFCKS
jgi:hypothetical protein